MHTKVELITPNKASHMLQSLGVNRTLSTSYVSDLRRAMLRGEWKCNGEAIKFSSDGTLLDGQHRLTAIASLDGEAFPGVECFVVRGLPKEVFDTLDIGKKRSASDVFSIMGEKNATVLATGLRAICNLEGLAEGSAAWGTKVTNAQMEGVLVRYPGARDWASRYASSKARVVCTSAIVGVLTVGSTLVGDEKAERFLYQVGTGEGLSKGDPALLFRDRVLEARAHPSRRLRLSMEIALLIKAWNAFVAGRKIAQLRMTAEEQFPKLAGLAAKGDAD